MRETRKNLRTGQIDAKFGALEACRAFAASVVVLHHAGNMLAQPRFYGEQPFSGHLQNFNVGVDFFFVLSGFIIAWVHWSDIGDPSRLGRYAVKRFLRIYPPYWGVLIPLILLYLTVPAAGIPSQHDPLNMALSLLLLPAASQPVLGVAWTLVHEVFFYGLFAVVIIVGRAGLAIFPLWALAIVAVDLRGGSSFPLAFFASPFNLEFIMGVLAAVLLRSYRMPFPWVLSAAGTGSFLALMLFAPHIQDDPLIGRLAFGASAFLAVLGWVEVERRQAFRLPRALALFGAASYSIYLVHPLALSFTMHLTKTTMGKALPSVAVTLMLACAGIGAGIAFHRFVEPALIRMARQCLSRINGSRSNMRAGEI